MRYSKFKRNDIAKILQSYKSLILFLDACFSCIAKILRFIFEKFSIKTI